jgi:hypothetical protein
MNSIILCIYLCCPLFPVTLLCLKSTRSFTFSLCHEFCLVDDMAFFVGFIWRLKNTDCIWIAQVSITPSSGWRGKWEPSYKFYAFFPGIMSLCTDNLLICILEAVNCKQASFIPGLLFPHDAQPNMITNALLFLVHICHLLGTCTTACTPGLLQCRHFSPISVQTHLDSCI